MIETGFFAITGAPMPLHHAIDIKDDYAMLAPFMLCVAGQQNPYGMPIMPWAELEAILTDADAIRATAGIPNLTGSGIFIPDLPSAPYGGVYKGYSALILDGQYGHDEIVDHSLIEIMTDRAGTPLPWRNRFALSAREKVDRAFRHRARQEAGNALSIYMPLAGPLSQTRIELLCHHPPILLNGTALSGVLAEAALPEGGQRFKAFFFSAEATASPPRISAGQTVEVPIRLIWNADGTALAASVPLKLDADAGYLPRRRLVTAADGTGRFEISALGLSSGERITIKLNTEHYSAIGKITLEVI